MATKTQTSGAKVPSIGAAQIELELATVAYLDAQTAFTKAADRLSATEERHIAATTALVNEVSTVRDRCRVQSITLKG